MIKNNFVKNMGWQTVKTMLAEISRHGDESAPLEIIGGTCTAQELSEIVLSHEIIDRLGGLVAAKAYVPDGYKSARLKKAIIDVECKAVEIACE